MSMNLKPNNRAIAPATIPITKKTGGMVVKAIITNQLALFYNEKIKFTKYYKHDLKKKLNPAINVLVKAEEQEFDSMSEKLEEEMSWLHSLQFDLVESLGTLDPDEYENVTNIIKAYKKNPKSIIGIAKKING